MDYDRSMKNIFKLLILSPLVFSIGGCVLKKNSSNNESVSSMESEIKEPTPVDVVLISGQSNAVGCTYHKYIKTSVGSAKYQDYMRGFNDIQIAYDCWTKDIINDRVVFYSQNKSKNETFFKVMLGQGNSEATFGPEIGIAEACHEKYGNKLFLIKYACGASNLKDDWAKRDSEMYPKFVAYVKKQIQNLKDMGYIPTIKAMCWMQGEGDSYPGYYEDDEYYKNTKMFVTNLREDLLELSGDNEFAFIDAGISNSKLWQYYKQVNASKQKFAEESENNIYIDTIATGMHTNEEPTGEPDTAHYDSESELQLGHLFAEQFEKFLMK